jgi:hypothetical protein
MTTYKIRDVKYWFDRETRVWWAARYDADGNQISHGVHAASREGIRREIEALHLDVIRADPKVETVRDERRGEADPETGEGIWAYLKPGWFCTAADSHACHEYTVENLTKAIKWAEPCHCESCEKSR